MSLLDNLLNVERHFSSTPSSTIADCAHAQRKVPAENDAECFSIRKFLTEVQILRLCAPATKNAKITTVKMSEYF